MTAAKRNTALIFAGTAMVLGILWVNSGPSKTGSSLMGKPEAMAKRPDLAARETVAYDAVAAKAKPLGAVGADPNAPVLNTPENGRAYVCTPVTTAHLVCRLLLETKYCI